MLLETSEFFHSMRAQNTITGPHPPPKVSEPIVCPRCESTNTKFCYYNNYNLSQPRHFCKACRRYWTHGGTLRNVPIGGGTRKNSKRSRFHSSSSTTTTTLTTTTATATSGDSNLSLSSHDQPDQSKRVSGIPESDFRGKSLNSSYTLNLNNKNVIPVSQNESFISASNSSQEHGFMGMIGYGSGLAYGCYEIGNGNWVFPGMEYRKEGGDGGDGNTGCKAWRQVEPVDFHGELDRWR